MTMPPSIARNPRKRREYLQDLCGLPDGQVTIREMENQDAVDKIIKKEKNHD